MDDNGDWVSTGEEDQYGYIPDELEPFVQGKTIMPAYYNDGNVKWDDRNGSQNASGAGSHQQSWAEVGAPGSNQLFDSSVANVIDKFVFVENTGDNDAYYRTVIAVECPEGFSTDYKNRSFFRMSDFFAPSARADGAFIFISVIPWPACR